MSKLFFNPEIRELRGPDGRVVLRPKVGALLELLIQAHPSLIGIGTCLAKLWPDTHVETRSLAQVVVELRKSFEAVGGSREWVENISKSGYRLTEKPHINEMMRSKDFQKETVNKENSPMAPARLRGWLWLSAFAVLVAALCWWLPRYNPTEAGEGNALRLAVLPVQGDLEPDMDWLRLAYSDSLSSALARTGLIEVVDFGEVYRLSQNFDGSHGDTEAFWQIPPVKKTLGANTFVRIEYKTGVGPPQFELHLNSPDGQSSFNFPAREAQSTVEVVAERVLDVLGLQHPVGAFLDNAYLGQTYAQGYLHYLKGEYVQAEPYLKICFEQNPAFNRHAYHLAYCFLHLRKFEDMEAMLNDPGCPRTADWRYLHGELEFTRRNFSEAEALLKPVLEMVALPRDIAARTNQLLGIINSRTDRFEQAQPYFAAALEHFEAANNLSGKVDALMAQLRTMQNLRLPVRHEQWEALIGYADLLQNRSIQSRALIGLGDHFYYAQQWEGAFTAYEKSLKIRRSLADPAGAGVSLAGMGSAAVQLRRFEEAEGFLKEALAINIQVDDTYNQVNQVLNLGTLYIAMRELDQAETMFETAKKVSTAESDVAGAALAILGLAEVAIHRDRLDTAASHLAGGRALGVRQSTIHAQFDGYQSVIAYKRKNCELALELMARAKSKWGESGWNDRPQAYLEIYQQTQRDGIYRELPHEKDPLMGPYP